MLLTCQNWFKNEKHVNCELLRTDLKCDQASPVKPTTKKRLSNECGNGFLPNDTTAKHNLSIAESPM